eukprot:7289446-Ditylum_brightwellii.AAC.1
MEEIPKEENVHTLLFMTAPLPSNSSCATGSCCMLLTISAYKHCVTQLYYHRQHFSAKGALF